MESDFKGGGVYSGIFSVLDKNSTDHSKSS